jgi:hypothetical protein
MQNNFFMVNAAILCCSFVFGLITPRSKDDKFWWDDVPFAAVIGMVGMFFSILYTASHGKFDLSLSALAGQCMAKLALNVITAFAGRLMMMALKRDAKELEIPIEEYEKEMVS